LSPQRGVNPGFAIQHLGCNHPCMPNMVSGEVGSLLIAMHNEGPPEEAAWAEYMQRLERILREAGGDITRIHGMTFTDGGAPDAAQRTKFRSLLEGKTVAGSIVSDSVAVRTVVGILSVFVKGISVHPPGHWQAALAAAKVPPERHEELKVLLRSMRDQLGPIRSLGPLLDAKT
jgi:hypothetical protein